MTDAGHGLRQDIANKGKACPPKSALKQALEIILQGRARVWNYQDDFDELWDLLNQDSRNLDGVQVILWSRTPPGNCYPVQTDAFVSPIVWAVCAASRPSKAESLRVVILDLAPSVHAGDLLREQIAAFRKESIPWLRVVRWTELLKDDAAAVRVALLYGPDSKSVDDTHSEIALKQLVQTLRFELTDPRNPDNRHAITNLIGPMILLGRRPTIVTANARTDGTKSGDHLAALHTVLKICGLIFSREDKPSGFGRQSRSPARPMFPEKTRFFLLDDQWHQGWGEWVCDVLGVGFTPASTLSPTPQRISADGDLEVFVAHDPSWLLERLMLKGKSADKRFCLSLLESRDNAYDVLLLDLRLFSGGPDRERVFIKKLLPLCEKFAHGRHPWPSFDHEELRKIGEWCGQAVDSSAPAPDPMLWVARTLLGRLIALTDFSLPIVLFSSTGDRDLIQPLAPYGNIMTSFSKPRTFGVSQPLTVGFDAAAAERAQTAFESAIGRAMDVLRARTLCRRLLLEEPRAEVPKPLGIQRVDGSWTIELYFDETGDEESGLTVGALMCVFPPGEGGERFDAEIASQIATPLAAGGDHKAVKAALRAYAEEIAGVLIAEAKRVGAFISILSLRGTYVLAEKAGDAFGVVEDVFEADNLFRILCATIIELGAYHVAPLHCPADCDAEYRVFMASRVFPLPDNWRRADEIKRRLWDKWGLGYEPGVRGVIRMFGFDAARPLVQSVANAYRDYAFRPRPVHARAYPLNNPGQEKVRVLHQITDALISPVGRGNNVDFLYNTGYSSTYSPVLADLLASARETISGGVVEGLTGLASSAFDTISDNGHTFERLLMSEIGHVVADMSSREFLLLARKLAESDSIVSRAEALPSRTGSVTAVRRFECLVKDQHGDTFILELPRGTHVSAGNRIVFQPRRRGKKWRLSWNDVVKVIR